MLRSALYGMPCFNSCMDAEFSKSRIIELRLLPPELGCVSRSVAGSSVWLYIVLERSRSDPAYVDGMLYDIKMRKIGDGSEREA